MHHKSERVVEGLLPFYLFSSVSTVSKKTDLSGQHAHDTCEVYINLSGNVSFMVGEHIYPVRRGSVIVARAGEYHHCIYHDLSAHEHIWLLFDSSQNKHALDFLFSPPLGEGYLAALPEEALEQVLLCAKALTKPQSTFDTLKVFFELLALLKQYKKDGGDGAVLPSEDVARAMKYVKENIASPFSVGDVAKNIGISVNTLERKLLKELSMTPSSYIQSKRLVHAAALLRNGATVQEACFGSGFSDCSRFISVFKREYGTTPLRYKKNL